MTPLILTSHPQSLLTPSPQLTMASRLLASLLSRAPKLSPASTPKPALPTAFSHPLRLLSLTARLTAAAHLLWTYGICVGPAEGPSMLPTFAVTNQLLLTSRLHRHGRSVRVGDLVVYRIPIFAAPGADGVKRVLGMPGDYVLIDSPDGGSGGMIQVSSAFLLLVGGGDQLWVLRRKSSWSSCSFCSLPRSRKATAGW